MKRLLAIPIFSLFVVLTVSAQVGKSTFIYSVKEADTLRLDKYAVINDTTRMAKPCIIFMFGGGFVGGTRDNDYYISYFKTMAEKGYVVVSIDYRLGMKKTVERIRNGEKVKAVEFPGLLANAIDMAVEDLYDATAFVAGKSAEWKIDPAKIISNGSSAGAISVLQAEYYLCTGNNLTKRLPDGFRYAGVIAFAGAIYSSTGYPVWQTQPAPIQFFHGDADSNVPYGKAKVWKYGLFGSSYLAGQLHKMNSPYYFYDVENATHQIAGSPMKENIGEIEEFINKLVNNKMPLEIHKQVRDVTKPEMKKKFGLKDYIKANFTPAK